MGSWPGILRIRHFRPQCGHQWDSLRSPAKNLFFCSVSGWLVVPGSHSGPSGIVELVLRVTGLWHHLLWWQTSVWRPATSVLSHTSVLLSMIFHQVFFLLFGRLLRKNSDIGRCQQSQDSGAKRLTWRLMWHDVGPSHHRTSQNVNWQGYVCPHQQSTSTFG